MATTIKYKVDGTYVNPPINWQQTAFDVNFDRDGNAKTKIVSESYEWVLENAKNFNAYLDNGTSGGPGILIAQTLDVEVERNGVIERPYSGIIDHTNDSEYSRESVKLKSIERKSIEWLESVADGFTFEYLKSVGTITNDDYAFVPYVINSIPDYKEVAVAILSAYVVYQQILDTIEKIKEIVAEIASGIGSISGILKAALAIAYIITLLASIIKVIKDIVTLLIQPVKYHACMSVKTLLEKGCLHLGLTLSGSILNDPIYSKTHIMPEKYNNPVNSSDKRILGFTITDKTKQDGFYKGTFGDCLRDIKDMFKAKIVIIDNVLHLEREDYGIVPPQFVMPDLYSPNKSHNGNEAVANYYLTFQTDTIEKNTLQEYKGTAYQVILSPTNSPSQDRNMLKGIDEVRLRFALAKRKTELSIPEKIIKTFLEGLSAIVNVLIDAVNGLISALNAVISVINNVIHALGVIGIHISQPVANIGGVPYLHLGNIIENRVNMMKLETDFTSVPKIFLMDIGASPRFNKLSANNEIYISAKYLYENFHFISSFFPSTEKPNGNQYIRKSYTNVPFGFINYQQVKMNNQIIVGGNPALVESFKWNPFNQVADIKVRISTLLTNNINAKYIEPDGK